MPADTTATHTVDSSEWYTPSYIIEPARQVLGSIEVDPASNEIANKLVMAERFFTKEDDAFQQDWTAKTIFINPPSPPKRWWKKSLEAATNGSSIIFIAYSIQMVSQQQLWTPHAPFIMCIPSRRITYLCTTQQAIEKLQRQIKRSSGVKLEKLNIKLERLNEKNPDELMRGSQPPHASAILGLNVDKDAFIDAYSSIGNIFTYC